LEPVRIGIWSISSSFDICLISSEINMFCQFMLTNSWGMLPKMFRRSNERILIRLFL
jgi:hypothetical protein